VLHHEDVKSHEAYSAFTEDSVSRTEYPTLYMAHYCYLIVVVIVTRDREVRSVLVRGCRMEGFMLSVQFHVPCMYCCRASQLVTVELGGGRGRVKLRVDWSPGGCAKPKTPRLPTEPWWYQLLCC
jgi:hypothetical protein